MRRLIVYYMMRLLITIRDRHGASQYAFRRLVIVWPSVLALTVAALWLAHDILWNLAPVAVEHAVSVPPLHPAQASATHGSGNDLLAWVEFFLRLAIGAGVLIAGAMVIVGDLSLAAVAMFAIGILAISQWSAVTEIFFGNVEQAEQVTHEQLAAPKRASDCQLIWFGPAGFWQCK